MMSRYSVYILLCQGGMLYTGIARDVAARFEEHRRGVGARYTASHRPRRIVYIEEVQNRSVALKREYVIKRLSRSQKLSLIQSSPTWLSGRATSW